MTNINYYSYEDLKNAVLQDKTQENINNLGEWFSRYGMSYWNGECFDADDFRVYPVVVEAEDFVEDENENWETVGYEIR